jgi:ATP-dependent Lon protease
MKKVMKRRSRDDDDDSSVDSKGNIRGLIAYDYDESDSDYTSSSSAPPPKRRAAIKAEKKIAKVLEKEEKVKAKAKVKAKPAPTKAAKKAAAAESSEEEQDTALIRRKMHRYRVQSSEEDEDDGETLGSEDTPVRRRRIKPTRLDEDEDEEDEDEEDEEEWEDEGAGVIRINIGAAAPEEDDHMIPKRHNMKKETPIVRKFVDLVTKPVEDVGIDAQIDQFKAMDAAKQKQLIEALENRPTVTDTGAQMMFRILTMKLPAEIQAMAMAKYQALQGMDPSTSEYFKQRNWLDKFCSVPFGDYKELPVTLASGQEACGTFMGRAKKSLDDSVYGQDEAKLQIMQFIASKIANPDARGLSLLLIGPPGIGKTSLIKGGIAKAIDWPFQFISLGGDSDASTYTGHQLVYESSHAGKIVNSLVAAKSMSAVLMFDEVDKISQTPKGEEVSNLLVHLTDPVQNGDFEDKYLAGVPIDLSKVMFVFSANDITKIDRVLLDRMNVIHLQGYGPKEKMVIAEQYLLPAALREVNLYERLNVSRDILQHIIENYAKEETGVRELKRCLEAIVQKVNMLRMYNAKELPFYIKDFSLPFVVKKEHVDLFLKKREPRDQPPQGMYC